MSLLKITLRDIKGLRHRSPIDPAVLEKIRLLPVAPSEFLLTAHLLPLVIMVDGQDNQLAAIVAPTGLRRQVIGTGNAWLAPYQPVYLRTLAFELGAAPTGDALADLTVNTRSGLMSDTSGEPVFDGDGRLSPAVTGMHQLLMKARGEEPALKLCLEELLIAGVAAQLTEKSAPLTASLKRATRLYTVSPAALAALSPLVLARLARKAFLGVELAHAIAFSRRWMRPDLLPREDDFLNTRAALLPAAETPAPSLKAERLKLNFDESELFSLP